MRKIRRYAAAAAVVLAAPALAGCSGDDPQPKISSSPTASSPASPSPTSSSATPEAETPEAFIRRWGVASASMQNSGDAQAYEALIDPDCQPCTDFVDLVLGYYAAGGYVETKPWQVRGVRPRSSPNPRDREFVVDLKTFPTKYKQSSSGDIRILPGGRTKLAVTLRQAEQWLVVDYLVIAS